MPQVTELEPLPIGAIYDGQRIIEVTEHEPGDDYQPFQYMLEDGETVWIPITSVVVNGVVESLE